MMDPDAYYKVYKGLHLLTYEAIPSIDNALKVWHSRLQKTIPHCAGGCPDGKKPNPPESCQSCVTWGNAIEAALYPSKPQITWQNVRLSDIGKSHVEAAKAFILRLPKNKRNPGSTRYTSIADFDSASVLKIMKRFHGYHEGDQASHDKLMKVVDMRNELSHMGLNKKMLVDDQKLEGYFQDLEEAATCLEQLHPQHFISAQDVRSKLTAIQSEPVTVKVKDEIRQELQEIREIKRLEETISKKNAHPYDLYQCKDQLKGDYKDNRGGIGFLPGMPKEFPLEEFFVELSLVQEEKRPLDVIRKSLVKYTDLLNLESKSGKRLWHVLIRGEAGTGKTTLINRLAYQWATTGGDGETPNPLSKFDIVFALNIRQINKPDMDLVDCIQSQLLPDIHREAIKDMVIATASRCLYLFDGYDELQSHQRVLGSKLLHRSFVIVTTRPDKVEQFCQDYSGFVHVKLSGFSEGSIETFVQKYFASSADEGSSGKNTRASVDVFLGKVKQSYLNSLSCFPLLLAMMCSIFTAAGELPLRMTALYEQVVNVFAVQYYAKASIKRVLPKPDNCDIDNILLSAGSTALHGLLVDGTKLIFDKADFDDTGSDLHMNNFWIALSVGVLSACVGLEIGFTLDSLRLGVLLMISWFILGFMLTRYCLHSAESIINIAVQRGILTKIYCNDKLLPPTTQYSFLHRTFQELSAVRYWSNLAESDGERFRHFLDRITTENVQSMQYLLRFCCGSSYEAARLILHHVVTKCDVDWRLPLILLFEAETDSQIHSALHEALRPLKSVDIGSPKKMTPELWSILRHYTDPSIVRNQVQTWLWNIEELSIIVENNSKDCMQFLARYTGLGVTSLKSFTFQVTLYNARMEVDAFKVLKAFLIPQLKLQHLALVDESLSSTSEWDKLLRHLLTHTVGTTTYLGHLIPNLKRLSLIGLRNVPNTCWNVWLDAFVSAGEALMEHCNQYEHGVSRRLPIRHFDVSGSLSFKDAELDQPDDTLLRKFNTALSFMSALVHLGLRDINLNATSLRVLAPAISRLVMLKTLSIADSLIHDNFRTNRFRHAGEDLSQILHNLTNLTSLNFAWIGLDDDVSLLPLSSLSQLTKLDLSGNRFKTQSWVTLSALLKYIPKLTELNLQNTVVSEPGMIALSASFQNIPLLKHLSITLRTIESFVALARGFQHMQNLQCLHILPETYTTICGAIDVLFRNLVSLPQLDELYLDYDHQYIDHSPLVEACVREVGKLYSAEYMYEYRFNRKEIVTIVRIAESFGHDTL